MSKIRETIFHWMIVQSVPILNIFRSPEKWDTPLENYKYYNEHSLGFHLYKFLKERDLEFLPKYEEHDAFHVLLGYGTSTEDELNLQAFMHGNGNSTFAGKVLYIMGRLAFPERSSTFLLHKIRGKNAERLRQVNISTLMNDDLSRLRQTLKIV